jgi:hypothetical protein
LNITIGNPSIRRLHEVGVAAHAGLLLFAGLLVFVGRLVGDQLALVLAGLRLRLRDAAALRLRMRESMVHGRTVFRHRSSFRMSWCDAGATPRLGRARGAA